MRRRFLLECRYWIHRLSVLLCWYLHRCYWLDYLLRVLCWLLFAFDWCDLLLCMCGRFLHYFDCRHSFLMHSLLGWSLCGYHCGDYLR